MPDLARFHPQIVHFAIALGFCGVALRLWSLAGPGAWVKPAATALLLAGSVAVLAAARSGSDAHGPVERIPGVRAAVQEHEQAGDRAHDAFAAVLILEVAALALRQKEKAAKALLVASAVTGLVGGAILYRAGQLGGRLVYGFAGGVAMGAGESGRLLVAGLHARAGAERAAGNLAEAARLTDELAKQLPGDFPVKLLVVESILGDRKDPKAALAALEALQPAPDDQRGQVGKGVLASKVQLALGDKAAARATLEALAAKYPQNRFAARALAELK